MNKLIHESTNETDILAYGTKENKDSGYYHTGWYIGMSLERRKLIANKLGLESLYCIGVNKKDNKIIIQLSRNKDPRNNVLEYVVVDDSMYDEIINIISSPISDRELKNIIKEDDEKMRLAGLGLL